MAWPTRLATGTLLRNDYLQRLRYYLPRRPGEILPGVKQLLEQLAALPQMATGLLTGNLREGARLKLQHYGLHDYFPFGGFGDKHANRDDVAREALAAVADPHQRRLRARANVGHRRHAVGYPVRSGHWR